MKLKNTLITISIICLTGFSTTAQVTDVFGNKIPAKKKQVQPIPSHYNQTDNQGLKQGPWEKRYTDGTPVYKATFKNDKLVGEYLRFHPNGKMSLRIVYDANGIHDKGELFNEKGELISSGHYKGQHKDGKWTFYTGKNTITSTEEYKDNKQHGHTIVYYPDGKTAETYTWIEGKKDGDWLKYFRSGAVMLKAHYKNNKLEGPYLYYFENGNLEIDALYTNDKEDGNWTFYLANGKINYILKYEKGQLLNPEVLEERRNQEKSEFEKNKANLKDPEKLQNDPDSFMQR